MRSDRLCRTGVLSVAGFDDYVVRVGVRTTSGFLPSLGMENDDLGNRFTRASSTIVYRGYGYRVRHSITYVGRVQRSLFSIRFESSSVSVLNPHLNGFSPVFIVFYIDFFLRCVFLTFISNDMHLSSRIYRLYNIVGRPVIMLRVRVQNTTSVFSAKLPYNTVVRLKSCVMYVIIICNS